MSERAAAAWTWGLRAAADAADELCSAYKRHGSSEYRPLPTFEAFTIFAFELAKWYCAGSDYDE